MARNNEEACFKRLEKIRDGQRHDVALRALFKTLLRMEREQGEKWEKRKHS